MTGAVTKVQHIAPPKADELQLKARAAGSKVQKPELTKAGPLGLMSLQVCTALWKQQPSRRVFGSLYKPSISFIDALCILYSFVLLILLTYLTWFVLLLVFLFQLPWWGNFSSVRWVKLNLLQFSNIKLENLFCSLQFSLSLWVDFNIYRNTGLRSPLCIFAPDPRKIQQHPWR